MTLAFRGTCFCQVFRLQGEGVLYTFTLFTVYYVHEITPNKHFERYLQCLLVRR